MVDMRLFQTRYLFPMLAVSLQAQTVGGIRIELVDAAGKPWAGQEIPLESLDRGERWLLRTDAKGIVVVQGLLPGHYRVRGRDVTVRPDELARLRLVGTGAAEVLVEGTLLQGETSAVGLQTRLDAAALERLPTAHRFVEQSALAPGVTPSGKPEPVVLGSMLDANAFVVDGMSTNLGSSGRFGMNLSNEVLESINLTTGGHKAEVGFAPGGVFNMVTKSGTNTLQGSLFGSRIDRDWNAKPSKGKVNLPDERATDAAEWGFSLGGPVVKDRLFFFLAFNRQLPTLDFEHVAPIGAPPHRRSQDEDRSYRFAKLTWLTGERHRLEFTYVGDPVRQHHFDLAGDATVKDEQLPDRTRGGDSFMLHHTAILSSNLTWTNVLGLHRTAFRWSPSTPEAGPFRAQLDAPGSESFGRYGEDQLQRLRNLTFKSEASLAWAEHTLKGGLQVFDHAFEQTYKRPSGGERYLDRAAGGSGPNAGTLAAIRSGLLALHGTDFGYAAGDSLVTASPVSGQLKGGRASFLYQRTLSDLNDYGNPLRQRLTGLFAQDDWRLGAAWTLHLGLRWDRARVKGEDGHTLYAESLLSPRLGLSWDPTEQGKSRIFAYAGRIFSPPTPGALRPAGATTDGPSVFQQVWVPSAGGWRTYVPPGVVALAPGLRSPYTDLSQLGVERELRLGPLGEWVLEAVATRKETADLVDTYDPAWGYLRPDELGLPAFTANVRVIGNLPGLRRTYQGLDLVAHRSFGARGRFQASYTYGDLQGNSEVGSVAATSPTNTGFARIPSLARDYRQDSHDGPLNEDVRHAFKSFGMVRLPRGLEVTFVASVRSGHHYARVQRVSGNDVLVSGATRGEATLPWTRSLDMGVAWNGMLGPASLRVCLEAFNLANAQAGVALNNRIDSGNSVPTFTNYQQPRVLQLGFRAAF